MHMTFENRLKTQGYKHRLYMMKGMGPAFPSMNLAPASCLQTVSTKRKNLWHNTSLGGLHMKIKCFSFFRKSSRLALP